MTEATETPPVKPPLLAYHGDPATKEKYLTRVRAHRAADRLVQGTGWGGVEGREKGCAVGCTLEKYDHDRYPIELGVPVVLARLEDRIFEGLDHETAMTWPGRFLAAIRPGADLAHVWPRFAIWVLEVELAKSDAGRPVAALYRRRIEGSEPTRAEWVAARDEARGIRDAAYERRSKAWDAYWAAVDRRREAAAAAAAAVEAVAEAVAVEAARWAARDKAWKAAWIRCADKLEELLAAA